jgi:hypothetical protein
MAWVRVSESERAVDIERDPLKLTASFYCISGAGVENILDAVGKGDEACPEVPDLDVFNGPGKRL